MRKVIFERSKIRFEYSDDRRPRLPRKQAKNEKYDLQKDTNDYFQEELESFNEKFGHSDKFGVEITVYVGNDGLARNSDLDNHAKAILDGIKSTRKIWKDDKLIDELSIKRKYTNEEKSYVDIKISLLGNE